jgi:plastocyanin
MDRRRFLVTAGVAATTGLGGCVSGLGSGAGDFDVGMTPNAFDPKSVTVEVGEEVVWKNTTSRIHTVTAYENGIPEDGAFFCSGAFESEDAARQAWNDNLGGGIAANDTYGHTFEAPGTFHYFCVPHEQGGMRGTVVVEE